MEDVMANKKEEKNTRHKLPVRHKPDLIELPKKNATGRPTKFEPKLARKICNEIANGRSLLSIEKTPGMPTRRTVLNWYFSGDYPNFNKLYDQSREMRAEYIFEESKDIADETPDKIVGDDKSDGARVQAEKLRVETRKWFAGVLAPRKYASHTKVDVTSGGKEIKQPRPVSINYVLPSQSQP